MLWKGRVLWGMMVYDSLKAIDYLKTRDDVDPERIGTLGHVDGKHHVVVGRGFDPRIKVCVDICGLTDYDALIERGASTGTGSITMCRPAQTLYHSRNQRADRAPAPSGARRKLRQLTPAAGLDRIDAHLREVYVASADPKPGKCGVLASDTSKRPRCARRRWTFLHGVAVRGCHGRRMCHPAAQAFPLPFLMRKAGRDHIASTLFGPWIMLALFPGRRSFTGRGGRNPAKTKLTIGLPGTSLVHAERSSALSRAHPEIKVETVR